MLSIIINIGYGTDNSTINTLTFNNNVECKNEFLRLVRDSFSILWTFVDNEKQFDEMKDETSLTYSEKFVLKFKGPGLYDILTFEKKEGFLFGSEEDGFTIDMVNITEIEKGDLSTEIVKLGLENINYN